ncbi:hypothetical protein [Piscirickettsia salmonis]|nr:hypothetical protein [Piscirickettsia salmonis]
MPARLYYEIVDLEQLCVELRALKCVVFYEDNPLTEFVITYEHEAKDFKLDVAYDKVPKKLRPIILGRCQLNETSMTLTIDLRSYERAMEVIGFIDSYTGIKVARLTHIATYNEMMTGYKDNLEKQFKIDFNQLFSEDNIDALNPEESLNKLKAAADNAPDSENKMELFVDELETQMDKPMSLVEKFPVHFYEEGISGINFQLNMRQQLACEHYKGNTHLTTKDIIQKRVKEMYS